MVSLIECFQGECEKRSRYFVGELTGRRLVVRLTTKRGKQAEGKVIAFINDEQVGDIDPVKGPPIGFFGFAMSEHNDVKQLGDVMVIPRVESKSATRKLPLI